MGGAPQVPPVGQQAARPQPQQAPQQAPRPPVTPMDPEVRSEGAWTALARIPGVGQKGSERGASNVRRRRL
jgi:hypothetical protein